VDAGDNEADTNAVASGTQPLPNTDLDGLPRFVDDPVAADVGVGAPPLVDMGALEYQSDCNDNGVLDSADLAWGTSPDCNETWVPDECELEDNDCDSNGIPDECDVAALIVLRPQDVLDCPGATVSFSVTAPGADAYQWYRDGVVLFDGADISGAQAETLMLFDVDAADAGLYWCKAARGCVASTSDQALLTVVGPLAITTQPVAIIRNCNGYTATFTVGVEATAPEFLWHKDGVPMEDGGRVSGSSTATLTILDTTAADNGAYTCNVWDPCGGAEESSASLLEIVSPVFVLDPQDTCVEAGETAVFSAGAVAPPSQVLGWRWKKNGVALADGGDISGSRTDTLTIQNVSDSDAGAYSALVYSSNPVCLTDSSAAALTVGDCLTCPTPGDLDGDGDYDLYDLSEFTLCFGQDVSSSSECVCANLLDSDDTINLGDWDELAGMIEGPM
jgi:hypothetical protein